MNREEDVRDEPNEHGEEGSESQITKFWKENVAGNGQRPAGDSRVAPDIPSLNMGSSIPQGSASDRSTHDGGTRKPDEAPEAAVGGAIAGQAADDTRTPSSGDRARAAISKEIGSVQGQVAEEAAGTDAAGSSFRVDRAQSSIAAEEADRRIQVAHDDLSPSRVEGLGVPPVEAPVTEKAEGLSEEEPEKAKPRNLLTNEGPVAVDDTGTTSENGSISVDVLANDTDVDDGDARTLAGVSLTSGSGSVSIVSGEVQFDPGSSYDHLAVGETATVVIDYVVEDTGGLTDTGRLTLTVTGSNDGPLVSSALADQSATEDAAFSYQVPSGSFADVDASDTLSYSATLADGSSLPGWLSFDPSTRTFSGTPANGDVGSIAVRVTATDDHGSSVDDVFTLTTANSNDTPDDLTLSNASVDENASDGTVVGTAAGSDEDAGDTLSYSLADDAGGRFAIDADSGEITVAVGSALDHETAASHDVTVRVTDAAGASYDETFTIAVGDVNEGPVAVDDTGTTSENGSISVDVLANDTDVDDGDARTLAGVSLTSGSGSVSIVSGEVQFDPGSSYDHLAVGETATVVIDYVVEDTGGLTDTGRLTLTVTGSNDGPLVSSALADQSATEDAAFSYQVPSGSFADVDASDTLSYSATLADGSSLPGWLSFDPSTRTFSGTPANGDVGSIAVRVTATDDHGSSVDDVFTLTTANSNDTPDDLTLSNASVDENASDGTVVGTAAGSDEDAGDTLSYSLADDAGGRFAIDADSGEITVAVGSALDHETAASHDVTVRVTDAAGASYDETFTIAVGDVNEGPVAVDDTGTTSENGSISVDVLANDTDVDDGDARTLAGVSLTSGSGSVSIVSGEVQFDPGSSYDHLAVGETATVVIDYVVEDTGGLTDTGRLTLTVTGSNDGPLVSSALADQSATEDAAFSYQVPSGSFADVDASDTLSYSATLADGSSLPGWLSFDPSTRTFSGTPANGDVGSIAVRVTATDDHGSSVDDVFTLTTANSNDTPDDLTLSNASVDENASDGTVVGTAAGSDEDAGDTLSYSLADDAGGRFAIDADSGEITVAVGSALDHETAASHDVTVRVTDAAGASYDETFTIAVGDVNEGPVAVDDTGTTSENGSISVDVLANDTDVDDGDARTLAGVSLTSGSGSVSIVSGEVQFDPGSSYDHLAVGETATVVIDYVVEDTGGLTDTGRLTLTVTGSNDGPLVSSALADQSATEDAAFSYQVPSGSFADVDASDTLSYSATLADGSSLPGWLSFDPSTRTFSGTPANGDVGSIAVRVTATDDHGSSVDDVFTLTTANSNDTPDDLTLSNASVDENASDGTVVGTAAGSDEDAGDTLSYSLADDAGGRFAIDADSGEITVAVGSALDHETAASHDVTVRVTDAAGASYDETFTIAVGDVNEGPVAVDDTGTTSENGSISVDVLANDTDVDDGDARTLAGVSLTSGSGSVSIVSGEVQFDPGSSYDHLAVGETATVVIDYVVEDTGGLTDTGRLTLTVTGSNDGPLVSSALADQSATEDAAFSYQVPSGSFADVDASDTLSYSATLADGSSLPGWLSFDPSTRTFSGTPANGDVGSIAVRVTATDDHGSSVDDVFTLTTANSNDTPDDLTLSNASVDENASDGTVVGTAAGSDEDAGDTLSYSLADDAGGRFAIDADSGEITVAVGSALDHETAASHDVTVRVTDAAGASYDETFTIAVGDVNEGPVAVDDTGTTSENGSISVDVLANDTDVDDGDARTLAGVSLTSGSGSVSIVSGEVQFDPGSSYDHLAVGETATVVIDYVVEDTGGLTDTGRLTLTVTGSNDGPLVSSALADQSATEDAAFSYQVPSGSFADVDASDTLSYSATLADGSSLPGWLSFDPSTRTFSGTPANGDVGSIAVRVTATDDHGSSVDDVFTLTTANSNDTPDDLTLSNASVDENASDGTVVGTAAGSDEDAGDTLSYSLADDAGGRFAIDADSGEITVAVGSALDHETAASHDVTVRVTDAAGASYDETFTIAVGDVNEGPVAVDDTGTTSENGSISVDVLANDTDVDDGDARTLAGVSLTSGSGSVSIVSGEVQFDPGSSYDHLAVGETATVVIDYVVEDTGGLTDTGRLTLTVTGSNDGPLVSSALADQSATEDAAFSYQVPSGSFADVDASDTLSYSATLADGSSLPGWLSFDPSTRTFSGTPANGDVGSIAVRVTATDDHGSSVDDVFTLTTANSNDTPDDLTLSNASVDENASDGTVVGTAAGSDEDAGDTLSYSLADDAGGRFAIDADSGEITVAVGSALDHETAASHDVTVRVTDAAGASYDETFTIAVGDVNEGPVAVDDTGTTSENGSISVDVLANDTDVDDGDARTLAGVSLTSGSGSVSIVSGEVQFDPGSSYDHLAVGETATVVIDYVVEDTGGLTDTGRLTLTVTGSNDGPLVSSALADQSATEDAAFSYQVPSGSFADVDASDTLSYSATLADGSSLPGWLSFDPSTRTFSGTPANGDVGSIAVRVTATDDHGSSVDDVFTLTTANSNDTPDDLTLSNASVDENASDGTVVGTAAGSDEDAGDTLSYSLADDAGGRFAIDADSGEITVAVGSALDHETAASHDVTVRVTDAAGASYDETFTIAVGDVNEGPVAVDDTGTTSENGSISVDVLANDTDVDDGDARTLAGVSLTSGSGSVSIVSGEVQFDPGSSYDHLAVGETATVVIDYVVEDTGGLTDTGRLTLTVTGSNDGPLVSSALADQSATEDAAFSYQVPSGSFADVDASDTLSYSATLADGSSLPGWLSFDPSTRTFSGTPANGDVGSIAVRVTATDDHGSSVDDVFTLTTANSNDTPDDLTLSNASVDENASDGTVVGTAAGSDEDAGDTLSYSLADDAGGRFAIDADSGEITVAVGSALDHETAASHDVTVRVTDAAGASYDETFTIAVGDVNEGPVAVDDTGTTSENGSISVDVLANDTDVDDGDARTLAGVSLTSGSGSVSIVSGEVQFDPGSSYDHLAVGETATVVIDYVVEDTGGLTDTGRLTLTVTGSNDGPLVSSALADQSATEDAAFSYQVPSGSFADVDASDTLSYSATLADGSSLPGWLSFDPSTRTFSGTPANGDVGSIAVRVTATDDHGSSVDDVFTLTTANSNDTPDDLTLSNASVDENASDGTVVGTAAGSDEDAGDTLSYSLADDAGGRFAIDADSGEITVAVGSALDHETAASHDVTVRVTDAAGASYDETFTIAVGDVNEGPVAVDDTGTTSENGSISVDVLANDTDVDDGDARTLAGVSLTSGSGSVSIVSGEVQFDPGSSYDHLAVGETATVVIDYVVEDTGGLTDTGRLTLTVTGSNDGPLVSSALADQSATEDAAFSYQVPSGSFADVDASDTLSYSATLADGSSLPGWLSFDPSTRTFSGTPANGDVGSIAVRVTATDDHGSSVDDVFTLTTANSNDTPDDLTLSNASVDENASDGTVVGTAAGSDEDAGDTLSYSLADDAGGRFAIDADSGEITVAVGSALDHETAASHDVTVRVTDAAGASYDETFTIAVGDVNEGPVAVDDTGTTSENGSISVDVLANDTDVDDGDARTLAGVSLTSGSGSVSIVSGEVQFDPGSSYDHLAVGETATVVIDYVVEDTGGLTDTGRLTLTVTGSNDGPLVSSALADQSATEDAAFSYQVPSGSFADVDASDTLSYSATLADGSSLPGWLSFDPSTRTFSGTPANGDVGSIAVRVTATDDHGSSVDDVFTLTTANSNDTPDDLTLSNASVDENASDGTVVGTAAGSDEDAGDTLSYSLADDAGGRFAIDADSGEITVAVGSALDHETAASHDVTVRVTDAAGASYDETFTINVSDVVENDITLNAASGSSGTSTTVVSEDFESGASGWSNNKTSSGGAGLDGDYLGNFGDTGGAQTIYKTFTLSGDQDSVTINFDFWEFDTWNGEEFKIWVDDQLISTDTYYTQQYYGSSDSSTYGTATSRTSSNLGGGSYNDQTHSYSFTIDSSATSIKLGFGASLDEALSNNTESWGIDNLEIIENQGGVTAPIGQASSEIVATGEIVEVSTDVMSIDRWSLTHGGGDLTIDMFADGFNGSNLDSVVYLYRDNGGSYTLVASNDDGSAGSDGSTSRYDSYLSQTDLAAGDYIIAVGAYGTSSREAISSGTNDNATVSESASAGDYQMTVTGNAKLNGIATDPSDDNPWGDANGQATIESVSGGGLDAGATLASASADGAVSYSLADDAGGRYSIDNLGNITLDVAHDGSSAATDSITIRTTDSGSETYDETVQINLGSGSGDTINGSAGDDIIHGLAGDDTINAGAGDDLIYGGAGTDNLTGGDGSDLFILMQGQGNGTIAGGSGGGWTDTIELQDASGGSNIGDYGSDWTVSLSSGSIEASDTSSGDGWLDLTDDAAGTITLQDGTEIDFAGVEHIQW